MPIERALAADPISAFGGVIGINRELDEEAAEEIAKLFVEAIAAPSFSPGRARSPRRPRRMCAWSRCGPRKPPRVIKQVSGGLLLQDADRARVSAADLKVVSARHPSFAEIEDLLFAWRVCKHVKSNAIVYARDGQTLGVGAGQTSRVDSARFGAMKAVLPLPELRRRFRRLLSLSRWPRGRCRRRRHRRHSARRIGARSGGDRRSRPARSRHGVYRNSPLPPLIGRQKRHRVFAELFDSRRIRARCSRIFDWAYGEVPMYLILAGLLFVVALLIVLRARARRRRQLEQHSITAEELHAQLASNPDLQVYDVRLPLDLLVESQTIPGAKRVPPKEIEQNPDLIPHDEDVVVYCTCASDETSRSILRRALDLNFTRVKFLKGGLAAWKAKGYPVDRYQESFHLDTA